MRHLLLLSLLFFAVSLTAQGDCPCCTEDHRAFDFWVGDWSVTDTTGTVLGENTIRRLEDGCLLLEHWRGASGSTGHSLNYYDRTTETWHQNWVDNTGNPLVLSGGTRNGKMVMRSAQQTAQNGTVYYNRITWSPREDGSVTQRWDIMNPGDSTLRTVFLGVYRKKE